MARFFRKAKTFSAFFLFILFSFPASTNFELRDFGFGSGGEGGLTSPNYQLEGILGEPGGESTGNNSNFLGGLLSTQQASVPPAPTFENNGNYYNKLHFVVDPGDNPSDAEFAIAISDDNFATTNYVQSDNTVGGTLGSEDYQTYADWGGASGEFVIGLSQDTTYKIRVKARQGEFSETGYGPESSAATVTPSISFSIGGVSSGTSLEGVIIDVTTTATQAPFGELTFDQVVEAASALTVSTNAVSGYQITVYQLGSFKKESGTPFPYVSGTNPIPSSWPASVVTGAYGYHTSDESLGEGTADRFLSDDTWAKFESGAYEIGYNSSPVINEVIYTIYSIETGTGQEEGGYSHSIVFIATGVF
ncbi:hypothetical protein A2V54_02190 [candidate division WWE3 bacterium RBG_19FT_COMBO_53_11]|uniref:Fibronectin type-III domain-containing protein n=1 Tax=candidate division WWE3 bacterium RBG_19FT_COMBO_53_11 TaxID=1802613 RepID=A0A1F4UJ14_UNCKA|nr:MAG: hypothetical protein A2155_01760 [candidate division WWE3 bacterium RBG_16_52_45]OGC44810.1 MAG: hypothetical protein A2V54_02190 [candidate division WWE3 bacterium RBG_19FT_COMBO_53_11]